MFWFFGAPPDFLPVLPMRFLFYRFIEPNPGSEFYKHDFRMLRIRLILFNPEGIIDIENNPSQYIKIKNEPPLPFFSTAIKDSFPFK